MKVCLINQRYHRLSCSTMALLRNFSGNSHQRLGNTHANKGAAQHRILGISDLRVISSKNTWTKVLYWGTNVLIVPKLPLKNLTWRFTWDCIPEKNLSYALIAERLSPLSATGMIMSGDTSKKSKNFMLTIYDFRPYNCETCGKGFYRRYLLANHVKLCQEHLISI